MAQLCNHGKSNSAGYRIVFSLSLHMCNLNNFFPPITVAFLLKRKHSCGPKSTKFAQKSESRPVQTWPVAVQEYRTCTVAVQESTTYPGRQVLLEKAFRLFFLKKKVSVLNSDFFLFVSEKSSHLHWLCQKTNFCVSEIIFSTELGFCLATTQIAQTIFHEGTQPKNRVLVNPWKQCAQSEIMG